MKTQLANLLERILGSWQTSLLFFVVVVGGFLLVSLGKISIDEWKVALVVALPYIIIKEAKKNGVSDS